MNHIDAMIGLSTRAGRSVSGLFLTVDAVRSGKARLVLAAEDAEPNTVKRLRDKCRTYHVPMRIYGTKERIGRSTGKENRSCAAITDAGFARNILHLLDQQGEVTGSNDAE